MFSFAARPPAWRTSALALTLLVTGCTAPIAGGLNEDDANRVVVSLDRVGIDATKEVDPVGEGHYRVLVAREEAARAVATLRDDELPPRPMPGVLDAMGKGALVPSGMAEHAQYVAGLGGDLERTLAGVDGVLAARVHLSVPAPDPLGERPPIPATASVLIKYRGATPPIDAPAVQHLVSGAVAGMRPADVAVVLVPRPAAPATSDRQIAHVGPLAVTRGTLPALRLVVVAVVAVNVVLLAALVALWMRVRRLRASAEGAEGAVP